MKQENGGYRSGSRRTVCGGVVECDIILNYKDRF
jgi:hypothetical protein